MLAERLDLQDTLTAHDQLDGLRPEWDALAAGVGAPPFLHHGWFASWWDAFGHGRLEVLALRRRGELAAVLPLVREGRRLRSATNVHTPGFAPLAADAGAAHAIVARAFALDAHSVELQFLDPTSPGAEGVRDIAPARGGRIFTETMMRPPYVDLEGSWEQYEGSLSRNRRKGLRRNGRRLQAAGAVDVQVTDGSVAPEGHLTEAFAVEAAGWKGRAGTAIACAPDTERFYRRLAAWAAEAGMLRLTFLRLDGRAIAFDYALEHGGTWYSLKAGYDEAYAAYGPGALLLRELLARGYAGGLRRFDLLGDTEPFKLEWATGSSERLSVKAFGPSPAARAASTALHLRGKARPAKKIVRALVRAS